MSAKYNIALVDDHEIFRNGLKAVLEQTNLYEVVIQSPTGEDFLRKLPNAKIDIVLMDIKMPGIGGVEASKKALEIYPELNILILSMFDDIEFYSDLIDYGIKGFLLKDSPFSELKNAVFKIISGENYFSQSLLIKLLQHKKKKTEKVELTEREKDILQLIAKGLSSAEISEELSISYRTVERHRANLFSKTNTHNSLKLLVFAIKNNLVDI